MTATTFDRFDPIPNGFARSWSARSALIASLAMHAILLAVIPDGRRIAPEPAPPFNVFLLAAAVPAAPALIQAQAREPAPAPPRAADLVAQARDPEPAPERAPPVETRKRASTPPPKPRRKVTTVPKPGQEVAPQRVAEPAPERIAAPTPSTPPALAAVPAFPVQSAQSAPVAVAAPLAQVAPPASPIPRPDPEALGRYRDTLSQHFARAQTYPRLAAMRGWEGEVTLVLTIARKGGLLAVRIARSSGHEVLDRHALALVEEGDPLPAPPEAAEQLEITVPVLYRLRSG